MLKKCKVVMLSTNEKAEGVIWRIGNSDFYSHRQSDDRYERWGHLYITSDDEIKEGGWFISCINGITKPYKHKLVGAFLPILYPKIIATTDRSLLTDISSSTARYDVPTGIPLPQPSQSFLEVFVREYNKGNVITDVLVEYENNKEYWKDRSNVDSIIVYSEEQAKKYNCIMDYYPVKPKINPKDNTITIKKVKDSWSREEVIELIEKALFDSSDLITKFPNGSVSTIVKDGTYGLNNWIEENL